MSSGTLNFFSAFDVEDDVTELLGGRPLQPTNSNNSNIPTTVVAASTLLSRLMQQQQQQQQLAAAASSSTSAQQHHNHQSTMNQNLVDGLMNDTDDWTPMDLFEMGSPDMENHRLRTAGVPFLPPPSSLRSPQPLSAPSSSSAGHHHSHQAVPTMADLAAAYWHGRATGAMSFAASVPSTGGNGGAAPAAPTFHPIPFRSLAGSISAASMPMPSNIPHSASTLTANIATANALANTEALNAQLLQHWLGSDGISATNSGATTNAAMGGIMWDNPPNPTPMIMPSQQLDRAFDSLPSLEPTAPTTNAAAAMPPNNTPFVPRSFMEMASPPQPNTMNNATASPSLQTASYFAPNINHRSRHHDDEASRTSASLFELESRLELARANAYANAHFHDNSNAVTAATVSSSNSNNATSNTNVLSSILDYENIVDNLHHTDEDDSMGTVDPSSDDEDENCLMPSTGRSRCDGGGDQAVAAAVSLAVDSVSIMAMATTNSSSSNSTSNDGASTANNNDSTVTENSNSSKPTTTAATASIASTRPRRQAAVRGLERISTALATHGMGRGSPDEGEELKGTEKKDAARVGCNKSNKLARSTNTNSKRKPTIIPKPTNKNPPKEVEPPPTCCICLEEPSHEQLASIGACSHAFCFECIEKWADQENTCPLCKVRFFKIDKVNAPVCNKSKKRKSEECAGESGGRSSKRVRNRDQRSDHPMHGFVNPLEGIFASMEANGSWPTHIAQLLFSGLGASSFGSGIGMGFGIGGGMGPTSFGSHRPPSAGRPPAGRRYAAAAAAADSRAAARRHQQRHVSAGSGGGFRYQPPSVGRSATSASAGAREAAAAAGEPSSLGLFRREASNGAGSSSMAFDLTSADSNSGGGNSNGVSIAQPASWHEPTPAYTPPPPRHSCPTSGSNGSLRTSSTTTHHHHHHNPFSLGSSSHQQPTSPWSASASVSVTLGPQGFAGRTSSSSSSTRTRTTSFQSFPNPNNVGSNGGTSGSSGSRATAGMTTGRADNSEFLAGDEEEELLSTLSPSSYIRRLHRELEGNNGSSRPGPVTSTHYEFNTHPSSSASSARARSSNQHHRVNQNLAAPSPSDNPFAIYSAPTLPLPASRTAAHFHWARSQQRTMPTSAHRNDNNSLAAAAVRNNPAAGRSVETALEIDSDDSDDVVEVIDVEALI